MASSFQDRRRPSLVARMVAPFLSGHLAVLLTITSLAVGFVAVAFTAREEEPQIVVPVADVYVQAPGSSAEEVEKLVATPLERILWQVDGVEYVYSVSQRDQAVVTVRFFVGENREDSLVKLRDAIASQMDQAPSLVKGWVVKPIEIDDVPILNVALYSDSLDDHALRRIAEEIRPRLESLDDISRTRIVGGRSSVVKLEPKLDAMRARGVALQDIQFALQGANVSLLAGSLLQENEQTSILAGPNLQTIDEIGDLVVGVNQGKPIFLSEVCTITDGPEDVHHYTRIGFGPAAEVRDNGQSLPAVTLAIAKKKGTNAVTVAEKVRARLAEIEEAMLPAGVKVRITRDNGRTADAKVDELLEALAFAMVSVISLLMLAMGWREGLVVALAVPISFALALFTNMLLGYTINRVTLFALILTLGLVVDDPIINVDNIQRHILKKKQGPRQATLDAVAEVLPPVFLSTLTVVVSFLPMFFITGMMGPYMAPMAGTVPLTVGFSMVAAMSVVPWAAYRLLRHKGLVKADTVSKKVELDCEEVHEAHPQPVHKATLWQSAYRAVVTPFLHSKARRWALFALVVILLGLSGMLAITGRVPMKMLPFDNKNELQLVLDLPEGSSLEKTDALVRAYENYLRTVPEVTDFTTYTGTYSPIDFNGMVRHYFFRHGNHLADIRINLADKDLRVQQSHEIGLRLRNDLTAIAQEHGAVLNIVESPPGPPVLATVVAEVYGPADASYQDLAAAAQTVQQKMVEEVGVVDVDNSLEQLRPRWEFVVDRTKAALHGIDTATIDSTLRMALAEDSAGILHRPQERQPLPIQIRLPQAERNDIERLKEIPVRGRMGGPTVPLGELGTFKQGQEELSIYHKNLKRVVFVRGEMAGRSPVDAVLALQPEIEKTELPGHSKVEWAGEGEWKITLRVFRDLGLAFGAAMLAIYVLLVVQTASFLMPLLIMSAIPLTAIGILPGFWLLNLIVDHPIGGYATPVFFTATAMIGMIALGGIVVRNSIVLIEFIQNAVQAGARLEDAIIESGIVRMRPILLTAMTTALGAWPITFDPIFSGLAWALIFGLFASTLFTLVVIPVAYYALFRNQAVA